MADTHETGSIIIGEGVVAKGAFSVPGRAVLNGTIEGELIAKDLLVGPTGKGVGLFRAETLEIRGELTQTVIATKSLVIRGTGRVSGEISYKELEIERGGRVEGRLANAVTPTPAAAPAPAPTGKTGSK